MKVSRGASLDRHYLAKLFGYGIFLHRIHHSDPADLYHSHPWSGLSLILGGYTEARRGLPTRRRWLWNWISAKTHHRVTIDRPVWTLFIHLRKSNRWSVVNEAGNIIAEAPWEGDQGFKDYSKVQPTKGPDEYTHVSSSQTSESPGRPAQSDGIAEAAQ